MTSAPGRLRQEDYEFQVSQSCIVSPVSKKSKPRNHRSLFRPRKGFLGELPLADSLHFIITDSNRVCLCSELQIYAILGWKAGRQWWPVLSKCFPARAGKTY